MESICQLLIVLLIVVSNDLASGRRLCGVSYLSQSEDKKRSVFKMMSGLMAEVGMFPWAVAIYHKNRFICTGSLLSSRHVITAAHCFLQKKTTCKETLSENMLRKTSDLEVLYGGVCLREGKGCEKRLVKMKSRKVSDIWMPKYMALDRCQEAAFDWALLSLDSPIGLREAVPVCLPSFDHEWKRRMVIIYGWGQDASEKQTDRLMYLRQTLLSPKQCDMVSRSALNVKWPFLCTAEESGRSLCKGDSGGGLIMQNNRGRFELFGVTSLGTNCANLSRETVQPGVNIFTDIRQHLFSISHRVFARHFSNRFYSKLARWI